jgi:hypothetical protein
MCPNSASQVREESTTGRRFLQVWAVSALIPPLYYGVVGLPTLVWHTSFAVSLMRLLSGILTAVMVGLALTLTFVWSRSRFGRPAAMSESPGQ